MTVLVLTEVQCTSAWLSHRFETVTFAYKSQLRVSYTPDTDRQLFFSLPYFGFRTSVSALQHFPLAQFFPMSDVGLVKVKIIALLINTCELATVAHLTPPRYRRK